MGAWYLAISSSLQCKGVHDRVDKKGHSVLKTSITYVIIFRASNM